MKTVLLLLVLVASVAAFAPQTLGVSSSQSSALYAKHVQKKAAKWAKDKRPRKSRLSDINRKPVVYELTSITKPAEYDISDAPASPAKKAE
jgi:hypothetical protein